MSNAFEMAPAAVVRIASWPLESLTELAAPALAKQVCEAGAEESQTLTALAQDYAAHIETSRALLWTRTAACPRFRAALALSSPALHKRLGDRSLPVRRNKAARHLETSVYRYLARAVARTEPFGLWTGVGLARLDSPDSTREQTEFESIPARVQLQPELGPYRDLLVALAQQAPYRERGPWRLTPTLKLNNEGQWHYARRERRDGALHWRSLPADVATVLERALRGVSGPLSEMQRRLQLVVGEALAPQLLSLALDSGMLVGGLDFPLRYTEAWDALERAQAQLRAEHAIVWARARSEAKHVCDALSVCFEPPLESMPAAALGDAIADAEQLLAQIVASLAEALSLDMPEPPRSWLRCDLGAAWTVHLGRSDRAALETILSEWETLEIEYGTSRRRVARAASQLRGCPSGQVMAPPSPAPAEPLAPPALGSTRASTLDAGPPLGALVLRPGAEGIAGAWLRGLSNVPTATHARHAYHLAALGDPLLPWFQAHYCALTQAGVEVVDLGYAHAGSPNLLARPAYVSALRSPWQASDALALGPDTRLEPGPAPGSLLVVEGEQWMSLHAFTATALPSNDPILGRLLATSFDERCRVPCEAPLGPVQVARSSIGPLTLEPRRVRLSPAEVEQLAGQPRFPRYCRWLRLAEQHALPELVRIEIAGRPGLVVPTTSPLALEAAFEGLRPGVEVQIEALVERGFVPGPNGHHIAELVLPVHRHHHLWQTTQLEELDHAAV